MKLTILIYWKCAQSSIIRLLTYFTSTIYKISRTWFKVFDHYSHIFILGANGAIVVLGASKIFYTYLLPCSLFENTKKIVFQTSNLPLAFQNK
jgi:hypothetical protein